MVIVTISYFITFFIGASFGEATTSSSPFSILTLHGAAGTAGFIFTALISYEFINPDGLNGWTYGHIMPLMKQIAASICIWGFVVLTTVLTFTLCNIIIPIGIGTRRSKVF